MFKRLLAIAVVGLMINLVYCARHGPAAIGERVSQT